MKIAKKLLMISLCGIPATNTFPQATIQLADTMLMHEMRATPYPLDGTTEKDRFISFQWPMPDELNQTDAALDGLGPAKAKTDKNKIRYVLRYSKDATFKEGTTTVETRWPFYNPETPLASGTWHWQFGYVEDGHTLWKTTQQLTVEDSKDKFCPPPLSEALKRLPASHPRILTTKAGWESLRQRSFSHPEREWYVERAEKILSKRMQTLDDINLAHVKGLDTEVKRQAMVTRESRRIIDREEANTEALIRAYLLTKDRRFADEALRRTLTMADWDKSKKVAGDFNEATMLSLCSMAYDAFYDLLTPPQKQELLEQVREKGTSMYNHDNNHLENHIADNHVWQMTLRILTMAAFSTYGDLPEAALWADYCYNVWLARFPGLNRDGGWHNGDSYFMVNARTLIEVPYFYSRLTGYDFFSDPWYKGNILYTIFEQPPFSKSGGNGSSHQRVLQPSAVRVGYLDALARLTGDTRAADFVRRTLQAKPGYLKKAFLGKSGDLAWFRLQCDKALPEGDGLATLPSGCVFPETGLASFMTNWEDPKQNAMLTFRSSPYGSTSHALANQNAFNTFFGGKSLFYSSGHHIQFTDRHSVYCHRATRAHNSILVDGAGQRIGTEGYGWIPRYYTGKEINYVVGDASNAYGKVVSPLWKERFRVSGLEDSAENGWKENRLKIFRRHIVTLGRSGLAFIYDELEADRPVTWSYLLHTVERPMETDCAKDGGIHIRATNGTGASDAYLYASGGLETDTTSRFFVPAVNWLRADDDGHFPPLPNHWHFSAVSEKKQAYHFGTILSTHAGNIPAICPQKQPDGSIQAGEWNIRMSLDADGEPGFFIRNTTPGKDITIRYRGKEATEIHEDGQQVVLKDQRPELEI